MAQIIKRETAQGEVRYDVRYRIDGRRVTKTFHRKKEADYFANKTETERAMGVAVDPNLGALPFSEYAELWLGQRHQLRPRTAEDYRDIIRLHLNPTFGQTALVRITPAAVRQWYADTSAKLPGRAHKAYRLLRTIMNTALADERIMRNPCQVKGAGQDKSAERTIPTIAEVQALADAMPDHLSLLIVLAAWCGLRRGELLGLRRCDIDMIHRHVRVARQAQQLRNGSLSFGPPKTRAGVRTVHFPHTLTAAIERHLTDHVDGSPESLLFTGEKGGPLRPHVLQGHWDTARTKVKVSYRLHDLRHLAATLAAATGATTKELMRRLGHASPQAALIYQHATEDGDRAIADALAEVAQRASVTPISPSGISVDNAAPPTSDSDEDAVAS